jgi:hypothetical protein
MFDEFARLSGDDNPPTYADEPVTIELEPGRRDAQGELTVRVRLVRADGETTLEGETVLRGKGA